MSKLKLGYGLVAMLFVTVFASSCIKEKYDKTVEITKGKYENGFFIVNEGWFGNGTGEVNFFSYDTGKLTDSIFKRENPTKDLKPFTSTVQFGTIYKENLYIVSKSGGPMVVVDSKTFKEKGRIEAKTGNDWRAFVGIDENTGLLSSGNGVYLVNLKNLSAYAKLVGSDGQVGDMIVGGKHIFMHSSSQGLLIYNIADFSLINKIKGMTVGFAKTPNGKIWYAGGKYLYQTDPQTLKKDSVELSFTANSAWGAWHSGSIVASTKTNDVFILKTGSFGGGNEVYKYDGNVATLAAPFITTPAKQVFYGKGIGYDPNLNQLVIQTVQSGYGANFEVNNLYFHEPSNGVLKNTIPYGGYHFPSITVFHQK